MTAEKKIPTGWSLGDSAGSLACSPFFPTVNKLKLLAQKQFLVVSAAAAP